ncbi:hypothetical protein IJH66_02870 [Candidatus Saccharibacteria bacterium]|nr:hypothetical protein [Candidatus Saccharibacteria bacterium]MBQ6605890.1 hypothetical protein [Candidatus Saccharibacteria bacterium]
MNEDNVIDGVVNYLKEKNRHRDGFKVLYRSYAKDGDKGIDLKCAAYSHGIISNRFYVEAKGTLKARDNSEKKSKFKTEFRWAISQIILQMKELSRATTYGIAIPETEKANCLKLMENNKGLKLLKIRLYLAYKDKNGEYFAKELKPSEIYK